MSEILDHISSVNANLFSSRNNPDDIRLGDRIYTLPEHYQDCDTVLLGCPQDIGVVRNQGRPGAHKAPDEIRKALYKYPLGIEHQNLKLFDLGDVDTEGTLEDIHMKLYTVVSNLLKDSKTIIVLGGGNDISYPNCGALSRICKNPLVFNIDKHLDVRKDDNRNSGTSYRQLIEEKLINPKYFYEIGTNTYANSPVYIKYLEKIGANIFYLNEIRKTGVYNTFKRILKHDSPGSIFWGFDMDVVRSVEAPGVSDPGPMGFTASEICEIADVAASDQRTRIIEITEVNPRFDVNGMTSKLAANIIMRVLAKRT